MRQPDIYESPFDLILCFPPAPPSPFPVRLLFDSNFYKRFSFLLGFSFYKKTRKIKKISFLTFSFIFYLILGRMSHNNDWNFIYHSLLLLCLFI